MADDTPSADFVDERERREGLPEHERDDPTDAGGGVMGAGMSAPDRGTGDVTGTAQGPGADDEADANVATGMVAGTPAITGSQPMAPVFVADDADEGVVPDDDE